MRHEAESVRPVSTKRLRTLHLSGFAVYITCHHSVVASVVFYAGVFGRMKAANVNKLNKLILIKTDSGSKT